MGTSVFQFYRKKIASSYARSFFVVCFAFVIGIAIAGLYRQSFPEIMTQLVLLVAVAIGFMIVLVFPDRTSKIGFLVIVIFCLGLFRYQQTFPTHDIPFLYEIGTRDVFVSGVVVEEVSRRMSGQQAILDHVVANETNIVQGKLLLFLSLYPRVAFGDTLSFRCHPRQPEAVEGFHYDWLLESRGIYVTCSQPSSLHITPDPSLSIKGSLLVMKRFLLDRLAAILSEPHATFIAGLLFGGSDGLVKELQQDFSKTGVTHIVAASGYNVAIFSQLLLLWLSRSIFGKRRALVTVSFFIVGYVVIAGAGASIVRAGCMGLIAVLGKWTGRSPRISNILIFTMAVMLFQNPRLLLDDVGFQLSFVATIALVVVTPRLEGYFNFLPDAAGIRESVISSIAAILLSTPLLIWQFGSISLIAPFTNLFVLPFLPYLMLLGFVTLLIGCLSIPTGLFLSIFPSSLSSVILHIVTWFGSLPFASLPVPHPRIVAIIMIIGCLVFLSYPLIKKYFLLRLPRHPGLQPV